MVRLVDISLRVRILAAFGLVLLVTLGFGGFALKELALVDRASDDLGGSAMPSLFQSSQMLRGAVNFRRQEANRLLSLTGEDSAFRESDMAEWAKQVAAIRGDYKLRPGADHATIDEFDRLWPQLLASTRTILDQLKAGDRSAARKSYTDLNRVQFDRVNELLSALVNENREAGRRSYAELNAAADTARLGIIVALVIAAGIALAAGLVTVATTASPIRRLTGAMGRLSDRALETIVPDAERRDEIGAMARAVEVFKAGLIEADRLAGAQRNEEAVKAQRAAAIDRLVQDFDSQALAALGHFGAAAADLDTTAQSTAAAAERTSAQTAASSAAAEQATANVETVAAATEQMAASIAEINGQVVRAKDIADRAAQAVGRTKRTVAGLTEATQKIGEVVTLIQTIAAQTNLLALNATIEAARAGEAGKGFAVVANEVKGLANQTARATGEISIQIAAVQAVSGETSDAIDAIGETIEAVNEISTSIAAAMDQQGASTNEISRNVAQAAVGTREIAGTLLEVADAARASGVASGRVLGAAQGLSRQSSDLQAQVTRFLAAIRAA